MVAVKTNLEISLKSSHFSNFVIVGKKCIGLIKNVLSNPQERERQDFFYGHHKKFHFSCFMNKGFEAEQLFRWTESYYVRREVRLLTLLSRVMHKLIWNDLCCYAWLCPMTLWTWNHIRSRILKQPSFYRIPWLSFCFNSKSLNPSSTLLIRLYRFSLRFNIK